MPFPFAAAGLAIQGASLLSRLFGKSAKQRRADSIKDFTDRANVQRGVSLKAGVSRIGGFISGQAAAGRNSAAQRATALGRSSDAEAFIAPAEERVQSAGSDAITNFVDNTNQSYDQMIARANLSGLDAEDPPSVGDYLDPIAQGALQYGLNKDYIDKLQPPGMKDTGILNGGDTGLSTISPLQQAAAPGAIENYTDNVTIPETVGSEFLVQEPTFPRSPRASTYRMQAPYPKLRG